MERGCQQNDSLADGQAHSTEQDLVDAAAVCADALKRYCGAKAVLSYRLSKETPSFALGGSSTIKLPAAPAGGAKQVSGGTASTLQGKAVCFREDRHCLRTQERSLPLLAVLQVATNRAPRARTAAPVVKKPHSPTGGPAVLQQWVVSDESFKAMLPGNMAKSLSADGAQNSAFTLCFHCLHG